MRCRNCDVIIGRYIPGEDSLYCSDGDDLVTQKGFRVLQKAMVFDTIVFIAIKIVKITFHILRNILKMFVCK